MYSYYYNKNALAKIVKYYYICKSIIKFILII